MNIASMSVPTSISPANSLSSEVAYQYQEKPIHPCQAICKNMKNTNTRKTTNPLATGCFNESRHSINRQFYLNSSKEELVLHLNELAAELVGPEALLGEETSRIFSSPSDPREAFT